MTNAITLVDSEKVQLYWEPAAELRWGKYISAIESSQILHAHEIAGTPTTAFEVGAEGGRWSKLLSDLGWRMTCTDIVADALSVCQQRIPEATCVLVERDSKRIPCNDRSQRMLLAIEVHELVEQDWFSEEVDRVLEPGGVFVGVFQNTRSWRAIFRNLMPETRGSFKHYTAAYAPWRKQLIRRGFRMRREVGLCWCSASIRSTLRVASAN